MGIIKKTRTPNNGYKYCLFSPTLKIPAEFSAWCLPAKLSAKPRNY